MRVPECRRRSATPCSTPSSPGARKAAPASGWRSRDASSRTRAAPSSCCRAPRRTRWGRPSASAFPFPPLKMKGMGLRGTGVNGRMGRAACCAALLLASCSAPDPIKVAKITDVETHWAVDNSQVDTQYIAPVVRFTLTNISSEPQGSIDVTATFRRKGETATWGGDYRQVSTRREPLAPGRSAALVLKSDTRYYSNGPPEGMLAHADFKDTTVEIFVRVGSSKWTKFSEVIDVERRIGARSVQDDLPPPSAPEPSPSGAP